MKIFSNKLESQLNIVCAQNAIRDRHKEHEIVIASLININVILKNLPHS